MPPSCRSNLAMPHKAFLHDPDFFCIAPVPPARSVSGGKDFNLGSELMVGHKVGLITSAVISSDDLRQKHADRITFRTVFREIRSSRSFCPCRAGQSGSLSMACLFWRGREGFPDAQSRRWPTSLARARSRYCDPRACVESYAGKWVTGFEKAAYRGGCRSLPELPEGTIRL